jgi:hypothetical protein
MCFVGVNKCVEHSTVRTCFQCTRESVCAVVVFLGRASAAGVSLCVLACVSAVGGSVPKVPFAVLFVFARTLHCTLAGVWVARLCCVFRGLLCDCSCWLGVLVFHPIVICTMHAFRRIKICTVHAFRRIKICTVHAFRRIKICTVHAFRRIKICTVHAFRRIQICTVAFFRHQHLYGVLVLHVFYTFWRANRHCASILVQHPNLVLQ